MDRQVKITITLGLLALVAGHAVLVVALSTGLDHVELSGDRNSEVLRLPSYDAQPTYPGANFTAPDPRSDANRPALDELKQQSGYCVPCRQPVYRQPVYVNQPQPVYVNQQPLRIMPAPAAISQPTPTAPRYQIALFVDTSAAGQEMLSWWNNDPQLRTLKAKCDFQVYTPSNALYQSRYASVVPTSQFPAVLFLRPDGGHIHATGGAMRPRSASELHSDLEASYRLAQSVEKAPIASQAGALRERGYNWDNAMQGNPIQYTEAPGTCLPGQPCNDGGLLPGIFGGQKDKSAMAWFSGTEIIICVMAGVAVLLVVVIVVKRM